MSQCDYTICTTQLLSSMGANLKRPVLLCPIRYRGWNADCKIRLECWWHFSNPLVGHKPWSTSAGRNVLTQNGKKKFIHDTHSIVSLWSKAGHTLKEFSFQIKGCRGKWCRHAPLTNRTSLRPLLKLAQCMASLLCSPTSDKYHGKAYFTPEDLESLYNHI